MCLGEQNTKKIKKERGNSGESCPIPCTTDEFFVNNLFTVYLYKISFTYDYNERRVCVRVLFYYTLELVEFKLNRDKVQRSRHFTSITKLDIMSYHP